MAPFSAVIPLYLIIILLALTWHTNELLHLVTLFLSMWGYYTIVLFFLLGLGASRFLG
jgi:hypothetical protein